TKVGYEENSEADSAERQTAKAKELQHMKAKLIISAILAAPLLVTMLVHLFNMNLPDIIMNPWFQFALATPVQFIIGWQFYVGAYKNLGNGGANLDVLASLGIRAANFKSIYD